MIRGREREPAVHRNQRLTNGSLSLVTRGRLYKEINAARISNVFFRVRRHVVKKNRDHTLNAKKEK